MCLKYALEACNYILFDGLIKIAPKMDGMCYKELMHAVNFYAPGLQRLAPVLALYLQTISL